MSGCRCIEGCFKTVNERLIPLGLDTGDGLINLGSPHGWTSKERAATAGLTYAADHHQFIEIPATAAAAVTLALPQIDSTNNPGFTAYFKNSSAFDLNLTRDAINPDTIEGAVNYVIPAGGEAFIAPDEATNDWKIRGATTQTQEPDYMFPLRADVAAAAIGTGVLADLTGYTQLNGMLAIIGAHTTNAELCTVVGGALAPISGAFVNAHATGALVVLVPHNTVGAAMMGISRFNSAADNATVWDRQIPDLVSYGGAKIAFEQGTYLFDTLANHNYSGIHMEGTGVDSTIIQATGAQLFHTPTAPASIADFTVGFRVTDMTIDANGVAPYCFRMYGVVDNRVERTKLMNPTADCYYVTQSAAQTLEDDAENIWIENNTMLNAGRNHVSIIQAINPTVRGNTMDNAPVSAILVEANNQAFQSSGFIKIQDNKVRNITGTGFRAITVEFNADGASRTPPRASEILTITGNQVSDVFGGIYVNGDLVTTVLEGCTISDNIIRRYSERGLEIFGIGGASLESNQMYDGTGTANNYPLSISGGRSNVITNFVIENYASDFGIIVEGTSHSFNGGTVRGNRNGIGFQTAAADCTFNGIHCELDRLGGDVNTYRGVRTLGADRLTFTGCSMRLYDRGIDISAGSDRTTVVGCELSTNTAIPLLDSGTLTQTAANQV